MAKTLYNATDMGNRLEKSHILPHLTTRWVAHNYQYFSEIGSTNHRLREACRNETVPAGTIFITDFQAAGKGRLDRSWVAPAGSSLLFSILFYPNWQAIQSQWLMMVGCLAIIDAVEKATNLEVGIKWPNDLVLRYEGVWHKFAGILVEGDVDATGVLKTAVFGIGINVNIEPGELPTAVTPPISLKIAHGQEVDRSNLLIDCLNRLEPLYENIDEAHSPVTEWRKRLITLGQKVDVAQLNRATILSGTAVDVNTYGQLQVQDEKGNYILLAPVT